jgi:hypothetical protein
MTLVSRIAVCIAALQVLLVGAKLQSGTVRIGGDDPSWEYVSKFGFGIGEGEYAVRVRLVEPLSQNWTLFSLDLDLYLDEDWDLVETMPECSRVGVSTSRRTFRLDVPPDGDWGRWSSGGVFQVIRPHIWYFALSNCDVRPSRKLQQSHLFEFEFMARQNGGSEFSIEMKYMLPANIIGLAAFTGFLVRHASRCRRFFHEVGSVHFVILALSLAMLLQYAGQVLHTLHLLKYSQDGIGMHSIDVLSEILFMLSQVVQTSLLIVIALGYSLFHCSLRELELVKPICLGVSLLHAALVGYGKLHDDGALKYHENEGTVGWVLLSIRLVLYVWFLRAVQASQQKGGCRLQDFLQEFQVAGSVYFLSYPLIFIMVQVLAPYLQHPILQTGLLAMQTCSHVWLGGLFLSRSNYFKVSVLSSSLLPAASQMGIMSDKVD